MNGKSPDAFRTISEVADWLGVNAHVLRFWESKFTQIKPVKRAGGRRYYRRSDMELLGGIQKLLHEDGMTIKGVQKILREQGIRAVSTVSKPVDDAEPADVAEPAAVEPTPAAAPDAVPETSPAAPDVAEKDYHGIPAELSAARATDAAPSAPARDDSMPLFGHPMASAEARPEPRPAGPPPQAAESPGVAPPQPDTAPTTEVPAPAGPVIAPLPGPDLPLLEALGRLAPLQIQPDLLAPIHAGMVALRARMDAAG